MKTDLVVVGGGHAGVEAAAAAARMGLSVALVTLRRETIGQMPCNPAIGGIGKGHLVAELDALGGLQGWAADRSALQFKMLNRSRGPAVWGPRAQCDKERYARRLGGLLERLSGVSVVEGEVIGLLEDERSVRGVRLKDGTEIHGHAVVMTTGTFLGGKLHTGSEQHEGGRFGEPASRGLGPELSRLGVITRRFKTGTPPRLDRESIDYEKLEVDEGDSDPLAFSWRTRRVVNRVNCWTTRTTSHVRTVILDNIDRSPLFSGEIDGVGPRYCPSIEDKVVRFPHHEEHTLFLEPETEHGKSMYVNGFSTSLPAEVQEEALRAVPGFESVRFLRHGYAVEYDVISPGQVGRSLELRDVPRLYAAGQVLGTSGYEEAAVLGFVAGVNAANAVLGHGEFFVARENAYVGVLVDDVVNRDHSEPYRMLTSRAEHRLLLGVDSARERLMDRGVELGLVPDSALKREATVWKRRGDVVSLLEGKRVNPDRETKERLAREIGIEIRKPTTWSGILGRHDINTRRAVDLAPGICDLSEHEQDVVIARMRYKGYVARQQREIERISRQREVRIPESFDPDGIPGLSNEVKDVMRRFRPASLREVERLPGVTPAAVAVLARFLAMHSSDGGE
ncbi:MAG: tRNA uridine-5-carboxymethylaminomethyl(34) synthesis enzyme MnmG [bacterium]|nr:tRNA uridine-5-carboxymethylaminomethyl(34) synthesis enzyme MnmG [bacterium]